MSVFENQLKQFISKDRLINDPILCYAYATDASVYRMVPRLVVFVNNTFEVSSILKLATQYNVKITFRAAGTSLCGQSVTDQVLLVLSNTHWNNYQILNNGQQIKLEPGIIGSHVNSLLTQYNRKIGPDPSSINSCKIGGIVANNSSGMCCGVINNTYHTMSDMQIVFADGSILQSGDLASRESFIAKHSQLLSEINNIKNQICTSAELTKFIQHKFRLKNTSAYSLNAFVDYDDPIDILVHLLVGSEGTLGFVSEITYNTVEDVKFKHVTLVYLDNVEDVANLAVELSGFDHILAMELLDVSSLESIKDLEKASPYLPELKENTSAVLIEVSGKPDSIQLIINKHEIYHQIPFTDNPDTMGDIWSLRKGIFPTIGANRISGSSIVIEDIAVDMRDLPSLITSLRELLNKYDYCRAAIFGHILAGNIHFVFTPRLDDIQDISNYNAFMEDLAHLVVTRFAGSLKAEHGCGRNVAPFVELEWGKSLYAIMWQIKAIIDPQNILNPDVILSHDKNIHLKHLKEMTTVDPLVDKCMECGACENICPAKNLSFTPRQRITTYRYIQKLQQSNAKLANKYLKTYQYYGIDTCATTGLCAVSCPVGINTGKLMLKLKAKPDSYMTEVFSKHYNWVIGFNKFMLKLANTTARIVGRNRLTSLTGKLHKNIPIVPVYLPIDNKEYLKNISLASKKSEQHGLQIDEHRAKKILYIPSCSTRVFDKTHRILTKIINLIGYEVVYLDHSNALCCGQFFSSSGYCNAANDKLLELNAAISSNSCDHAIIDNSSCYYTLLDGSKSNSAQNSKIVDIVDLIWNNLDKLNLQKKYNKIALHIDCSSKKIGNEKKIMDIINKCSSEVVVPYGISCCGFAGTKGFNLPELNAVALYGLEQQIVDCELGVTFNQNCQIGLSFHGKKNYVSLPELISNCIPYRICIGI